MTWDKPIKRGQCEASPEQIATAWGRWRDRGELTFMALSSLVALYAGERYGSDRVADAMLQKARKAGEVYFQGGRWHFTEAPDV